MGCIGPWIWVVDPGAGENVLKITSVYIVQYRAGFWLDHMKRIQETAGHIARAGETQTSDYLSEVTWTRIMLGANVRME